MGLPQTPSSTSPHLYPQALQLKLYQAFIFSVPILFSIILLLLFYLFYLKRRRDSNIIITSPATLTRRLNQPTSLVPLALGEGLKEEVKEKLLIVIFDEDLRDKDSQCCVCLGDFELKEQLHQIPSCQHLFHIDCIHDWLKANHTCPLCRCYIYSTKKLDSDVVSVRLDINQPSGADSSNEHHHPQAGSSSEQHVISVVERTSSNDSSDQNVGQSVSPMDLVSNSQESTSRSVCPMDDLVLQNSVVIQVEMHTS
ncbi:hypothetical protein AQUCO_01300066v1 [Aquilegia coerulea]|uniref:RING-type E3 ubiquitin transferase n=1 Tax=Aquilegia coerulea TaxID=218851 RepID=A0A2G5DZH6_AQUCA|nr:hypothetical protein AQUCO_01300066v1 [Aquilegia coerulea]